MTIAVPESGEQKMAIKEVNSRKFDAIMKKRIDLHTCPRCPAIGGEIIIPLTCVGTKWRKVYVRCKNCGFETKSYDANTCLNDTENHRLGNFVIDKSLMAAIHNAINDWNGRSENGKAD